MNIAQALQLASKGLVVAPAGYGKTHLIAEAVVNYGSDKELILTHTHAGVDSLRKKISSFKPTKRNFHIETIDGFILRFVLSYPKTCGWKGNLDAIVWAEVRQCGISLFKKDFIKKIIRNSYSGIYVDEYQDCCTQQHDIVLEISSILPTRIVGDPLQGIFDFKENKIVDWDNDVLKNFNSVGTLNKAWRWENANNSELGNWLEDIRKTILDDKEIVLNGLPSCVRHVNASNEAQIISECNAILSRINDNETIAIIGKTDSPPHTHRIAKHLKGRYGVIEPIDSKDLKKIIDSIDTDCVYQQSIAALGVGTCCFSGINETLLKNEYTALEKKTYPTRRKPIFITSPLLNFLQGQNLQNLLLLLRSFNDAECGYLCRKELYWETLKIVNEAIRSGDALKTVMVRVRENSRRFGRRLPRRLIGRTVLIKGLEFDHVIIVDADSFNKKNLYVALTRASKTVTIISKNSSLLNKKEQV